MEGVMTAEAPPPAPELPAAQPSSGWTPPPPAPVAGPAPGLRYGGFWVRVVAFILDGIVLGVLTAALAPLVSGGNIVTTTSSGVVTINYTANALGFLIDLLYFVGFWAWRGQSPGMIPFNMRIVMADDGSKVDVVRCLLRYVGLIISFVILFLGVIWVGFDRRKQGWHDKIAGTVVVRPA
jgi:uncharacterized RDD family membrane protein YckC